MFFQNRKSTSLGRRRRRKKAFILGSIIFVFISAIIFGQIDFFFLKIIDVVGADGDLRERALSLVKDEMNKGRFFGWLPASSTLFFPTKRVQDSILSVFPEIYATEIDRKGIFAISLNVHKRIPVGLVCNVAKEKCFQLDADSFIFREDDKSVPLIIYEIEDRGNFVIDDYLISQVLFRELTFFVSELKSIGFKPKKLSYVNTGEVRVFVEGGAEIVAGFPSTLAESLENMRVLSAEGNTLGGISGISNLEYIDVRFGSKVFYRR